MADWHEIPGHPHYEITRDGRVRSLPRKITRSDGVTLQLKGKELQPGISGRTEKRPGYLAVSLGAGNSRTIHTLLAETFLGSPEGRQVRHLNGDSMDNRLENLAYDETGKQNSQDTRDQGKQWQQKKTHCPRGHKLEGDNLEPSQLSRGWRSCKACRVARSRAKTRKDVSFEKLADEAYQEIDQQWSPLV